MQQFINTNFKVVRVMGCLLAMMLCGAKVQAATAHIEVHGVLASDATKDEVPKSLERYKKLLKFTSLKDQGHKSLKIAAGASDSATIDKYTVDIQVKSVDGTTCKIEVALKEGDKAILKKPAAQTLTKGEPQQLRVGDEKSPTIILITLDDVK